MRQQGSSGPQEIGWNSLTSISWVPLPSSLTMVLKVEDRDPLGGHHFSGVIKKLGNNGKQWLKTIGLQLQFHADLTVSTSDGDRHVCKHAYTEFTHI